MGDLRRCIGLLIAVAAFVGAMLFMMAHGHVFTTADTNRPISRMPPQGAAPALGQ